MSKKVTVEYAVSQLTDAGSKVSCDKFDINVRIMRCGLPVDAYKIAHKSGNVAFSELEQALNAQRYINKRSRT